MITSIFLPIKQKGNTYCGSPNKVIWEHRIHYFKKKIYPVVVYDAPVAEIVSATL